MNDPIMWKGYELWKLYCKISMLRRNEKSAVHRCVKSSFSEKCYEIFMKTPVILILILFA